MRQSTSGPGDTARLAGDRPDWRALRAELRLALPEDAFERQPAQAVIAIGLIALITGASVGLFVWHPPAWMAWLPSIALGIAYGSLGFLAHEILHGSVVRSRAVQDLLGGLGLLVFCVSPSLWRSWHNHNHHKHTNLNERDPDCYGTVSYFKGLPMAMSAFKNSPGSGRWRSFLNFPMNFTNQGFVVTWFMSFRSPEDYPRLSRSRVILESIAAYSFWAAMIWATGWFGALFLAVIPMLVANAIASAYIATQHFMRPLVDENNPFLNSMSVKTAPWIDAIHFNFSHHVEHHLFPRLNHRHLPAVREAILTHCPDDYLCPGHLHAIRVLYQTPRIYLDPVTLYNLETERSVALSDVESALRAGQLDAQVNASYAPP